MSTLGMLKQLNGQTFQLSKRINILGRANSCHIIIKHASASKEHCLIEFDDKNNAFLKDLESLNGTYLNEQRLKNGQSIQIFDQDVIQVGQAFQEMVKHYKLQIDQNKFTFLQQKVSQQISQQRSLNYAEQTANPPEQPRKDKDFKISVVDYSFRDNSFSKQPQQQQKRGYSPLQGASPYSNNNTISVQQPNQSYQLSQQETQHLGNIAPNTYNMRQQRTDKLENVKHELYNQNIDLNDKILQREEQLIRLENEIKLLRNENDALIEENDKFKAKQKALQLYSSELQKQIDILNDENKSKNMQLAELSEQDWTRKLQENNLVEYENRNNECSKRWTSLLQENADKDDKIKGLKLQLSRQIETMQTLYSENDRKINEYNNKFMRIFDEHDEVRDKQREAAEFLVQQVALMQEERKNLAVENENLHTQIQELISEIEKMKSELENYAILFDVSIMDLSSNKANQGNIISKLKNRIDELEDMINETKQKESVGKLVELQDLYEELEKKLDRERIISDELNKSLKTLQISNKSEQINEQNCIDFFSNLLDEKDKKIQILLNQIQQFSIKEKQYGERIEDLNNNLMLTNKNFNEYKNKNDRMTEIIQQNRQVGSAITAQFGGAASNHPSSIISNERVSEKMQSDARIYKSSYNDYE